MRSDLPAKSAPGLTGRAPAPRLLHELLGCGEAQAPAVSHGGSTLSYADLRERAESLAATLIERGLLPGERVVLVLPNGIPFVLAIFAVWRAGAIVVPLDYRSPGGRILALVRDCGATAMVCNAHAADKLLGRQSEAPSVRFSIVDGAVAATGSADPRRESLEKALRGASSPVAVRARPGDSALLLYTSGSTGQPKGVMHSHRSLIASLEFSLAYLEVQSEERALIAFPLYHGFPLHILLLQFLAGACAVLTSDILAGLKTIRQTRPSALPLVPAACALLARRLSGAFAGCEEMIGRVSVGSAAIAPALLEEVQRLLPNARIDLPYGMSEARIAFLEPVAGRSERRLAAVSPGLELSVVDANGAEVRVGTGELVLRGPALMLGYFHDSAGERERRARDGFHTRDLVECTANGDWFLVGRADAVINVGGEKVFPAEVEAVLLSHPQVRDARVEAADDPQGVRGQIARATIVVDGTVSHQDIVNHCRQRLEPYKVPQIVDLVGAIERNELGKVVRSA